MRRAERLFRLVDEMRTRPISRAEDLAQHFEVSVSTIYRDIAHLQASGLPIEGEAGVGYILRPGFNLPSVTFTNDQLDALAIGLAFVERNGDPSLSAAAREARAKIQASLPAPEERRLADAPFFSLRASGTAPEHLGAIRDAIRERHIIEFGYSNGQGTPSHRRIRPMMIWNLADGWMFSGWCELRNDFRTFRFDRVDGFQVLDDVFVEEEAKSLRLFLDLDACEARGF
ncbi:MAG: YafY family protein [Pseudomonadota bacterium]